MKRTLALTVGLAGWLACAGPAAAQDKAPAAAPAKSRDKAKKPVETLRASPPAEAPSPAPPAAGAATARKPGVPPRTQPQPGPPGQPERRVVLPLAPTAQERAQAQQREAAARARRTDETPTEQRTLEKEGRLGGEGRIIRRLPTRTGSTAGPGSSLGPGTNQDRKASIEENSGPTGFRK